MDRTSAQKPSKTNASKHSIHFPPFQGHKKSIRNSLFSNSLSKMLHFFSMKFATNLDFTGFPVISHVVTHIPRLTHTFDIYSGSPQCFHSGTAFYNCNFCAYDDAGISCIGLCKSKRNLRTDQCPL